MAPAELEALLLQHSGVADCGVVGLPDEVAGELPLAFVVPQTNIKVTEQELVKYIALKVILVIYIYILKVSLLSPIYYQSIIRLIIVINIIRCHQQNICVEALFLFKKYRKTPQVKF